MVYIRSSILGCFALFIILQPSLAWCSTPFFQAEATSALHHKSTQHDNQNELSPKMTFDVTLHGLLLWASLGFLMPIGTLIIRMSNRQECGATVRVYFYFHLLVQMLAIMLATAGAIMSIKTLENAFNNSHQRVGLALYGAIWVQAVLGFCRPPRFRQIETLIPWVGNFRLRRRLNRHHQCIYHLRKTRNSASIFGQGKKIEACFVVMDVVLLYNAQNNLILWVGSSMVVLIRITIAVAILCGRVNMS